MINSENKLVKIFKLEDFIIKVREMIFQTFYYYFYLLNIPIERF